MSNDSETERRAREAAGAHPHGRCLERSMRPTSTRRPSRSPRPTKPYVDSLAPGVSVPDVSGEAIEHPVTEELSRPAPVFHGDTLSAESEVLEARPSRSKPDRGTVRVRTGVHDQDGVLVAEFKRIVLVPRRPPETAA